MDATTYLRQVLRRASALGAALALVVLAGCGGGGDESGAPIPAEEGTPGPLVRLEVSPKAMTFTAAGSTRTIAVRGFDAAGREVALSAPAFTSSNPAFASVGASGVVQPLALVGSALIDVRVGDVVAPPVTVLALRPAENVVLITDEQIIAAPSPVAGSPHATVRLTGSPAPTAGALLLGTGGIPLGGRVVAASAAGGVTTLEIEDVPITSLVTDMDLRLSFTPEQVNASLPAGPLVAKGAPGRARTLASALGSKRIGPFACESKLDLTPLQGELEAALQTPAISFELTHVVTGSMKTQTTILAKGKLDASLKAVFRLGATLTGEFDCKAPLTRIVAPVFGVASLIAAPTLPVNAEFSIGGEIGLAGFSVGATDTLGATADLGFEYEGSAGRVHSTFDVENDLKPLVTVPAEQGVRAKIKAFAGLGSGLDIGIGNLGMVNLAALELVSLQAGPELEIRVAAPYTAATDTSFDTGYDLKAKLELAPGSDVEKLFERLLLPAAALDFSLKAERPLASSPQASSLQMDHDVFALGDTLRFTVDLAAANVTFPIVGYNVTEVRVYRLDHDTLTATPIAVATAAPGQTHFELSAVADVGGAAVDAAGKPIFVAYLVDVPLAVATAHVPLELGPLSARPLREQRLAALSTASVVIRDDGRAVIRGTNNGGALGLGLPIGQQSEATVMDALVDVKQVSGSSWCGVALLGNGHVYAWGWGQGIGLARRDNPLPVLIDANAGARNTAISTGYSHSLILKEDGSVWRFGGSFGPPEKTGLGPAVAIAAGNTFDMALHADGTVWTVGQGSRGQLGNGQLGDSTTPVMIFAIDDVVAIAAGDSFGLMLRRSGQVWSWGEGHAGQLGNGGLVDSAVPHPVEGLVNVSRIAAGEHHGMALTNGVVYTWGFNGVGALGTGDKDNRLYPVQVLTGARDIDGSESTSLAALANGTVMGWGLNDAGQIGNNRTSNAITRPVDTLLRVGAR